MGAGELERGTLLKTAFLSHLVVVVVVSHVIVVVVVSHVVVVVMVSHIVLVVVVSHVVVVVVVSHVVVVVNLVWVSVDGLAARVGRFISWVSVLHLLYRLFILELSYYKYP